MFAVEMCGSSLHIQCWEMENNLQLLVKSLHLLQIMTNQIYFIFASELKDSYGSFIKMTLLLCVETLPPIQRGLNGCLKLLLLQKWNKFLLPVTKLSLHFHPNQEVWLFATGIYVTKWVLVLKEAAGLNWYSLSFTWLNSGCVHLRLLTAHSQTHTHTHTHPPTCVCVCVRTFTGYSSENQCGQ